MKRYLLLSLLMILAVEINSFQSDSRAAFEGAQQLAAGSAAIQAAMAKRRNCIEDDADVEDVEWGTELTTALTQAKIAMQPDEKREAQQQQQIMDNSVEIRTKALQKLLPQQKVTIEQPNLTKTKAPDAYREQFNTIKAAGKWRNKAKNSKKAKEVVSPSAAEGSVVASQESSSSNSPSSSPSDADEKTQHSVVEASQPNKPDREQQIQELLQDYDKLHAYADAWYTYGSQLEQDKSVLQNKLADIFLTNETLIKQVEAALSKKTQSTAKTVLLKKKLQSLNADKASLNKTIVSKKNWLWLSGITNIGLVSFMGYAFKSSLSSFFQSIGSGAKSSYYNLNTSTQTGLKAIASVGTVMGLYYGHSYIQAKLAQRRTAQNKA